MGQVIRKRKSGLVAVTDADAQAKNALERAYTEAEAMGIAVWCEDKVCPYQTVPYPGPSWQPKQQPEHHPHEYFQEGTAKLLTLLYPKSGHVRVKGVTDTRNLTLHRWLKTELEANADTLHTPAPRLDVEQNRRFRESWRGRHREGDFQCCLAAAADAVGHG
ncbi:hypothetical protein ANRL4_03804 [Anaerolineae bacterium]|nr:hypothetical protein ANRL4_03804 [Anaerolineae bacterium]